MMKVLIAYDGSASADAAVEDLPRAGIKDLVDAVVLSVADVWYYPAPVDAPSQPLSAFDRRVLDRMEETRIRATQARRQSETLSRRAVARLRQLFPSWKIHAETVIDWPGWAIIREAEGWGADLVVMGAGQHSVMERITLGSVSRKVVDVCQRSVRVARRRPGSERGPVHLLFGLDGSVNSEMAVDQAAQRLWPTGSEARLITALDSRLAVAEPSFVPGLARWRKAKPSGSDGHAWIERMMQTAKEKLTAAGLTVFTELVQGDPRDILLEHAATWEADTLFLGARGLSGLERFLIGSVSSALAGRAICSVEVVRGTTPQS